MARFLEFNSDQVPYDLMTGHGPAKRFPAVIDSDPFLGNLHELTQVSRRFRQYLLCRLDGIYCYDFREQSGNIGYTDFTGRPRSNRFGD